MGGFIPGMNLTWGDIPHQLQFFGEKISGFENSQVINFSLILRHLEAKLIILMYLKLIRGLVFFSPFDLRFAVFLLCAKRRRSTSKYLNFPPYDVIGIKLKSMISATNTAVR
jgi:hypothetical protein